MNFTHRVAEEQKNVAPDPSAKPSFRWPDGKRAAVSLTFDDARPTQIDHGIPIMDAYGVKGTFYVVMYQLEKRLEGWQAAVTAGHEIGNHTLTHPCSGNFNSTRTNVLENYTLERMEEEFAQADEAIVQALGVKPTTFAYPCGQKFVGRGEDVRSYVPLVARHFDVGRGAFEEIHNDPGFCDLAQATGMDFDGASIERCKTLIDRTVARGGWLILHGHEVAETGQQNVLSKTLDALCRLCQDPAQGLWIDTVAAIGTYVRQVRATPETAKILNKRQ